MPTTRGKSPSGDSGAKKPRMSSNPPQKNGVGSRMSSMVTFGNVVYLSGQVPNDVTADIKGQTQDVLSKIDKLLEESFSDKTKLLQATIYLKDISSDFAAMNEVWEAWVPTKYPPARATMQAKLAREEILVEIVATAALCKDYPEDEEEAADEKAE